VNPRPGFHVKHEKRRNPPFRTRNDGESGAPLDAAGFAALTGAPAESVERLGAYLALLEKWQGAVNLVGRGTLRDAWRRHMLDSAQLHPLLPAGDPLVLDMGSGAGFPGMVLAILGGCRVHLVEANARKCAFLQEVDRTCGGRATIHNGRIEDLDSLNADVVTARAVAPLNDLLALAQPHLKAGGACLFPKGRSAEQELTDSMKNWKMRVTRFPSQSDPSGAILKLEEILRRHG